MSRSLILIAAAALVVTTAPGATINILNTFDGGQAPPPGGPGPNGPGIPTVANGVHALGVTFTYTKAAIRRVQQPTATSSIPEPMGSHR